MQLSWETTEDDSIVSSEEDFYGESRRGEGEQMTHICSLWCKQHSQQLDTRPIRAGFKQKKVKVSPLNRQMTFKKLFINSS